MPLSGVKSFVSNVANDPLHFADHHNLTSSTNMSAETCLLGLSSLSPPRPRPLPQAPHHRSGKLSGYPDQVQDQPQVCSFAFDSGLLDCLGLPLCSSHCRLKQRETTGALVNLVHSGELHAPSNNFPLGLGDEVLDTTV